jgi:hypothetical protein
LEDFAAELKIIWRRLAQHPRHTKSLSNQIKLADIGGTEF